MAGDPTPVTYACYSGAGASKAYIKAYGAEKASTMMAIYQGCSPFASFKT